MAPTKRVDNEKCKLPPVQNGRVEKKMSPAKAGGSPAKAEKAAREPIPSETLLDALLYLDRGQLEAVQHTSSRFKTIVEKKMDGVCLRQINEVRVSANENQVDVELKSCASKAFTSVGLADQTQNAQPGPSGSSENAVGPLVPHLRNTVVLGRFMVCDCRLTPPLLDAFRGIVHNLRISDPGFLCVRDVSPARDVYQLLDVFASMPAFVFADPLDVDWEMLFDLNGIDDALLRSCVARGVAVVNLPRMRCSVSEDAILEWCFASDKTSQGVRFLELKTERISARFLQRLVELHESSENLNALSLKIAVGRREFALNADWNVERSNGMLRVRRLMRPITHRDDLEGSFMRLEIYHHYKESWDWRRHADVLVIRRGVDTAQMDERLFSDGDIKQACASSGQQDAFFRRVEGGLRFS